MLLYLHVFLFSERRGNRLSRIAEFSTAQEEVDRYNNNESTFQTTS